MNNLFWTSLWTAVVANRSRRLTQLAKKTFDAKNLCSNKSLPLQPWYLVDPFVFSHMPEKPKQTTTESHAENPKHICFHPESISIWNCHLFSRTLPWTSNSSFSQIHSSKKLCVTPNTYLLRKPHCVPSENSSLVVSCSLNIYPIVDSHNHT